MATPLIEARGLTKHFKVGGALSRNVLHAVDKADFVVNAGEIVALVGESGSGKSTIARLLARVHKPTSGEILYQGRSLSSMRTRRQTLAYHSDVPMVFQDPFASLSRCTGPSSAARSARPRPNGWSTRWASRPRPRSSTATRTSCPAASGSGSASPRRWRTGRS